MLAHKCRECVNIGRAVNIVNTVTSQCIYDIHVFSVHGIHDIHGLPCDTFSLP